MRSSQKGFGVLGVLLVIVVLGVIGSAGWYVYTRQSNSNTDTNTSRSTDQSEEMPTPQEVIADIKDFYADQYKFLNVNENNQPVDGEMSIGEGTSSPLYKAEGYTFYNDYDGGASLSLMAGPVNWSQATLPRAVDVAVRTKVAEIYTQNGLTKTESPGDSSVNNIQHVYVGNGVICSIEAPDVASSSVYASCGAASEYKAAAAKLQPIADAIPGVDEKTTLAGLEITDSSVKGYQRASVGKGSVQGDGGAVVMLYKKDGGPWTYFTTTQMGVSCTDYNTTDLKNAYKGEVCYLESGETGTVQ